MKLSAYSTRLSLGLLSGAALMLTACAGSGSSYRPIVDTPVTAQYETDLQQCQSLSTQRKIINGDTQTAALAGAATGGVIGLLRRGGNDGNNVLEGAAVGGTVGGVGGAFQANTERKNIVKRCMSGRGYRVIG